MRTWLLRSIGIVVLLVFATIGFVWLLLAAPLFSEMRRDLVEKVLSEQIGQPIVVNDDVSVALGRITHIYVGGVVIPSQTMPETSLAELNLLELELDVAALANRRLHFDNLVVDGLQANFLTAADGTTSWRIGRPTPKAEPVNATEVDNQEAIAETGGSNEGDPEGSGILSFLSDKNVAFTSIGLNIDDQTSGFSFVFDLQYLALEQVDKGQRTKVSGTGSVNGQSFEIEGDYPHSAPFATRANFGEMTVSYDGEPFSESEGGGYRAVLQMDTGEFGDFLEVIGLERVLEGNGQLQAELVSQDALKIETFTTTVNLEDGQQLTAEGSIEDLYTARGVDLLFDARLYPEGQPPNAAKSFQELKFTAFEMHMVGSLASFEFEKLLFQTNAFDQGLDVIGPASIERIRRMPDGRLAMLGIALQAGPIEDPILKADGEILDLLQLQDVTFEGTLNGPANLILPNMDEDFVDRLGGINADFSLSNEGGPVSLNRFNATTYGTDIWALDLALSVSELKGLSGLDFDVELDVSDGASFLTALKLQPVEIGALAVDAVTSKQGEDFTASIEFEAGSSHLLAALDAKFPEGASVIRGNVASKRLDLNDLKNLTATLDQLKSLVGDASKDPETDVQPLVLPKETNVQPLVLPKEKGKPADLLDVQRVLREADVEVQIDFKEIVGQQGVTSVSSQLSAKEGTVDFGPLQLAYGGGNFSLRAVMDLIDSPDWLSLSGSTSGWEFGEILDELGIGIDAYGRLSGEFNVSGSTASGNAFVNSMRGTASLSMSQGYVSTSLLELAGLGIFPWLFSEELRQGYTDITCVVAPINIEAGRVSSDSIVVETGPVQLVAKGQVDWVKDTIAIRAEPRRVGKPLSRSAWPFDVTGQLSSPKFKLDVGGSRNKAPEGADAMPADRQPCVPDMNQLQ
ncbi:AsmA-like C-terminal region-containing protein [Ruegeria atlantica]|uniref:Putative assembly protein n=1 Tax=Ruegeria atlantica TaxID=81569 RepID=A0A0P1ELA2_9RHOB|nr:AsmA-like C-terminal region-containing protein [Ruegeria atlantica]CUH41233.1 putative assembly protein [Ruegeria atlantica]